MVLVYAGNSPLETARAAKANGPMMTAAVILEDDQQQ
jgi:hypothetical protein